VQGLVSAGQGLELESLGFGVQGSWLRILDLGFKVYYGLGFRV
jgi:hypothetical protein